jgi:hypothetical protein
MSANNQTPTDNDEDRPRRRRHVGPGRGGYAGLVVRALRGVRPGSD